MTRINSRISSTTDQPYYKGTSRIISTSREYDGYFKIDRYAVEVRYPSGNEAETLNRYVFERGDAVTVLLHDAGVTEVVLVRQFRMPPLCRKDDPWILETVAGTLNPGDVPVETAVREVFEETGIRNIHPVDRGMFYLSPGGSSERCFLFSAVVDTVNLAGRCGGEPGTDERTCLEVYSLETIRKMLNRREIRDAKTIIALQDLLIHRGIDNEENATVTDS